MTITNLSRPSRLLIYLVSSLLFVVMAVTLAACTAPTPAPTPALTDAAPLPLTPTEAPTVEPATVAPTPIPTPAEKPASAILLAAPGSDPALSAALMPRLEKLAKSSGLTFRSAEALDPANLPDKPRIVVVIPPDPGLAALASALPETRFVSLNVPGVRAGANVETLAGGAARPDQAGFLAGYIAAVITTDWRVGVIARNDTPASKSAWNAYRNGAVFYCGLCRPSEPPFVQYPAVANPGDGSPAAAAAAVKELTNKGVDTVYVEPGAASEALYAELAKTKLLVIGSGTPPETLKQRWVATIGGGDPAAALEQFWSELLQGRLSAPVGTALQISNVNPDYLSPGKQYFINQTAKSLAAGLVDSGVDPATGEPRP
jgi:hypothetical protein